MDWFGTSLSEIGPPYQRVKLIYPQLLKFKVLGWSVGYVVNHVQPGDVAREQVALALVIDRLDKKDAHQHWALVGPEPVAILEPRLSNPATAGQVFSIQAIGRVPAQRWIITSQPA